jgi:hypothetical protein
MIRPSLRAALAAVVFAGLSSLAAAPSAHAAHPDLFYNYYVGPSCSGAGTPAQLYLSPRPTPPWVGHTYTTYQPLMPHEYMYHHCRKYYKHYRDGGYTTACIKYH